MALATLADAFVLKRDTYLVGILGVPIRADLWCSAISADQVVTWTYLFL